MNDDADPYARWLEKERLGDARPDLAAAVLTAVSRSARRIPRIAWAAALLLLGARVAATLAWLWVG